MSEHSKLMAQRAAASAEPSKGQWHPSYSKTFKKALAEGVPVLAVWTSPTCPRCATLASAFNAAAWKQWMKSSGIYFFLADKDDSDAYNKEGGDAHWWILGWSPSSGSFQNTNYPGVRLHWREGGALKKVKKYSSGSSTILFPAGGKVRKDWVAEGDQLDGAKRAKDGANTAIKIIKDKLKEFFAQTADAAVTYKVQFFDADGQPLGDAQDVKKGENATAPEAPVREGYRFVEWSPDGLMVQSSLSCWPVYEKLPDGQSLSDPVYLYQAAFREGASSVALDVGPDAV